MRWAAATRLPSAACQHADSLAPRVARGIGKTADTLREFRNG
jgi:hypothetical protein